MFTANLTHVHLKTFLHLDSQVIGKLSPQPDTDNQPTAKSEWYPLTSEQAVMKHKGITSDVTITGTIISWK